MLRHATHPKTDHPRAPDRVLHKLQAGHMYTVVFCPPDADGERMFSRGAAFNQHALHAGLTDDTWPEGMQFQYGGRVLTVRGGALVVESQ